MSQSKAPAGAVAKREEESPTLGAVSKLLEKYKDQIEAALPRHMTPERMIRLALTAVSRSADLQKCNPLTICGSIVQASLLGLEPDGTLGEAYLVPWWNRKANGGRGGYECQLIPGYLGLVKLVRNTDELSMIDVKDVHENDIFEYEYGLPPKVTHKPPKVGDRGEVIGYWAGAMLKNGATHLVYMTTQQIEEHRDQYSKGAYNRDNELQGAWKDSPHWMYAKTPLRQLCKLLPKSPQAQLAVSLDERAEAGLPQRFSDLIPAELQPTNVDDDEERTTGSILDHTKRATEDLKRKVAPAENGPSEQAATTTEEEGEATYPAFTGVAQARSLGDQATRAEMRKTESLATEIGEDVDRLANLRYGINFDELSKAAMADFQGFLKWLGTQKGETASE